MKKKLLVSFASLMLVTMISGCTSGDTAGEEDAELVSNAEIEEVDGDTSAVIETTESAELSEALPENSLAETTTQPEADLSLDASAAPEDTSSNVAQVEQVEEVAPLAIDESTQPIVTDATPTETIQSSTTPDVPVDPVLMGSAEPVKEKVVETPKKTIAPLQKITAAPYMVDSKWVNAVYIARPGDSLKSISKKIYGEDRSKELKKINTAFKSRSVKPGDKVYYSSVLRPDDSSKISLYYEENGIPSQSYVAQKGDNIRKVSKKLLGYDNAWKEVWATNSVESKWTMQEGEVLRYWPANDVVPVPSLAQAEPAPAPIVPPAPQPDFSAPPPPAPDMAMAPPPPPPDMGNSFPPPDMAPPPPPDMAMTPPPPPPDQMNDPMAAGVMNELPPPPPDIAPEPVAAAPKKQGANIHEETEVSEGMDVQSMGLLGAIGLFAIALVMIIVKRKRKQKEQEALMSETHVGSM